MLLRLRVAFRKELTQFFRAKVLVVLVLGLVESWVFFGVPVHGSLALFFGLSFLLFFAAMGLGAYVGAVAHNLGAA